MQPDTRRANLEVRIARLITPGYARDLMADIESTAGLAAIEALLDPTAQQVRQYSPPAATGSDWDRLSPLAKLHRAHGGK
ncbi:hypothetical protein [Taklimakanibacter deserti]|uniref:hypothetical protein n=1 Tax=Taklimakanibacter deserti TaxID=2267839 RepID=UPI0013C5303E